jgi:hypothetical protein
MYIYKALSIVGVVSALIAPGLWSLDTTKEGTSQEIPGDPTQHRGHFDRWDDDDSGLRPGNNQKDFQNQRYDRYSDDRWDDDNNGYRYHERRMDRQQFRSGDQFKGGDEFRSGDPQFKGSDPQMQNMNPGK